MFANVLVFVGNRFEILGWWKSFDTKFFKNLQKKYLSLVITSHLEQLIIWEKEGGAFRGRWENILWEEISAVEFSGRFFGLGGISFYHLKKYGYGRKN